MRQPGYRLPLSTREFTHALQAGLGRAVLHVRRDALSCETRQALLDACQRHPAYDPQCEYDRTPWMLAVVRDSGLEEVAAEAVSAALATSDNHWDLGHAAELAVALAKLGFDRPRAALYQAFDRRPPEYEWAIGQNLIALEGPRGIEYVVRELGKRLLAEPEYRLDPSLQSMLPGADRLAGQQDPELLAFYEAWITKRFGRLSMNAQGMIPLFKRPDRAAEHARVAAIPFTEIWQTLRTNSMGDLRLWGRIAPAREVEQALPAMLRESDPGILVRLMYIFLDSPLPQFDLRFFDWLDHDDADVCHKASIMLGNTSHPLIREEGLRRYRAHPSVPVLRSLCASVETGDAATILASLPESPDPHEVVFVLVDMYADGRCADSRDPLLYAYDRSPCSNCRGSAIKGLRHPLPDWLREEAPYDCNEEIRSLAS